MQKNALEDDWRIGTIEAFVERKTETCILEIWTEALRMLDKPNMRQSREIALILDSLEGWERGEGKKRFGAYASQRFWQMKMTAHFERINDDYVEIVD